MKKVNIFVIVMLCNFYLAAQIFIPVGGHITAETGSIVFCDGNLTISENARLDMTESQLILSGNLEQNGRLISGDSEIRFRGALEQTVTGNLEGEFAIGKIILEKLTGTILNNAANVEILNQLEFISGIIQNDLGRFFVNNSELVSITGFHAPNGTSGEYAENDRYIIGELERVIGTGSYICPVGSSSLQYNPITIDNTTLSEQIMKIEFAESELGTIDKTVMLGCMGEEPYDGSAQQFDIFSDEQASIDYTALLGKGFWKTEGTDGENYGYVAYPNTLHEISESDGSVFQLVQESLNFDPTADWSNSMTADNICIHSTNPYESLSDGHDASGILGIAEISGIISSSFDPFLTQQINIYPNPASNRITIENNNATLDQVQVFNALGQSIFRTKRLTREFGLNLSNWEAGTYYLQLRSKDGLLKSHQFVKL